MINRRTDSIKEAREKERRKKDALAALEAIAALEDALCEIDEANAERFAAIENALCDIDAGV